MQKFVPGLWLTVLISLSAIADESAPAESAQPQAEAPESAVPDSDAATEEKADADIRKIEQGVSGAEKVEEFVPDKPLSADKAISLPSDI